MEAMFVKESMNVKWAAEAGLVENIESTIKEFKQTRGLLVSEVCFVKISCNLWNLLLKKSVGIFSFMAGL